MPVLQMYGYLLSIFTILIYLLSYRNTQTNDCPIVETQWSKSVIVLGSLLCLFSTFPRVYHVSSITHESFIFEEISASIIYISKLLIDEKTYSGATQILYALLFDIWRKVGGFSVFWARSLSGVVGIIGLLFYYLSFKKLINKNAAFIIVGLFSCSLYACFFSRLAIETGWALTIFALNLYVYSCINQNPLKKRNYFFLGLTIAMGLVTYPGYTLGLCAYTIGLVVSWLLEPAKYKLRTFVKCEIPLVALGILIPLVPVFIFHITYQAHAPLFFGGGVFSNTDTPYLDSVMVQLNDIFVAGTSYYLPFLSLGFVESWFWGYFVLGVSKLVFQKRNSFALTLFTMILLLPFLVALARNYPGMRRGIMFLAPFYYFSGTGLYVFIKSLENSVLIKKIIGGSIVLTSFAMIFYAQGATLESAQNTPTYSQFNDLILEETYKTLSEKYHIILVMDDFNEFDVEYLHHAIRLLDRYEPTANGLKRSLTIYSSDGEIKLNPLRPNLLITNTLNIIEKIGHNPLFCLTKTEKLVTKSHDLFRTDIYYATDTDCVTTHN